MSGTWKKAIEFAQRLKARRSVVYCPKCKRTRDATKEQIISVGECGLCVTECCGAQSSARLEDQK